MIGFKLIGEYFNTETHPFLLLLGEKLDLLKGGKALIADDYEYSEDVK